MTRDKLNRHISLLHDLRKNQELKAALETAAGPGAQVLTGMPRTPGSRDKLGDLAAEIADVSRETDRIRAKLIRQEPEISAFIDTIQDAQTRTIFRLRCLRGMGWGEVASVMGGKNTPAGVRVIYFRYLRKRKVVTR